MPTVRIKHNPGLTAEKVMEIFNKEFTGKYEVYMTKLLLRDFVIKKSAWTGIAVRVKQKDTFTELVFNGFMPGTAARLFFGGIVVLVLYFGAWKNMQNEIKEFIERSTELN